VRNGPHALGGGEDIDLVDSLKNIGLSAAGDLGLGAQLQQSVDDEEEERKRKLLQQAQAQMQPGPAGVPMLNPATMQLFGSGQR
jgi:hypothetical protein